MHMQNVKDVFFTSEKKEDRMHLQIGLQLTAATLIFICTLFSSDIPL